MVTTVILLPTLPPGWSRLRFRANFPKKAFFPPQRRVCTLPHRSFSHLRCPMSSLRSRARESKVVTTPSAHHRRGVCGPRLCLAQDSAVQRHRPRTWRNKSAVRRHNIIRIPEAWLARSPPSPPPLTSPYLISQTYFLRAWNIRNHRVLVLSGAIAVSLHQSHKTGSSSEDQ